MASITWGQEIAEAYDTVYAAKFEPSVIDPMAGLLASLAGSGPVLEFAVGTGRVALALSARGVPVRGIELSPHMAERLRAKPGADAVPVTVGDMTTTRVPGPFTVGQIAWSRHWMAVDGHLIRHSAPYRYVWPSELDLMARIAGFRLEHRWASWDKAPFTSDSKSQVAVYEKAS